MKGKALQQYLELTKKGVTGQGLHQQICDCFLKDFCRHKLQAGGELNRDGVSGFTNYTLEGNEHWDKDVSAQLSDVALAE